MLNCSAGIAFIYYPERSFNKSKIIYPGIGTQGNNQSNVGPLRGLDGTNPAIMGRMNVTHLKARTFTGQTPRPQSRKTPFMGSFGQRIGLIHKLGQLGCAKKLTNNGRHRLGIDKVVGHHGVHFLHAHLFLDSPLHTDKTDPVVVFQKFTHSSNPPVSQVVDIVNFALGIFEFNQRGCSKQNILFSQSFYINFSIHPETMIHFKTTHLGQIIICLAKKQMINKILGNFNGSRIAGTKPAINVH